MFVANDSIYICNLVESMFNISSDYIYSIHELVMYSVLLYLMQFSIFFSFSACILKNCAYYG